MTEIKRYRNKDLLNRLSEMQRAPYYATACQTLVQAEMAIVALEDELRSPCCARAEPVAPELFDCDIAPRPLSYNLREYHIAPSEGPLNFTWQDKPHRLLYDLIAAVKYYTKAREPMTDEEALTKAFENGIKAAKEHYNIKGEMK